MLSNLRPSLFKKCFEDKSTDYVTLLYLKDIQAEMHDFVAFMLKTYL